MFAAAIRAQENLEDDNRLRTWLRRSTDASWVDRDDHALRHYYMILEDMHGGPSSQEVREVKWVRDLVSHGPKLQRRNKSRGRFFAHWLGDETPKYDRTNPKHQDFVRKWRAKAGELVRICLKSRLDNHTVKISS